MTSEPFVWPGFDEDRPEHQVLRGFLVLDVQYSARHALEVLGELEAYRAGRLPACGGNGNAYEYECRPEGVYFDGLYDGDPHVPALVDYDTVTTALTAWTELCQRREAAGRHGV